SDNVNVGTAGASYTYAGDANHTGSDDSVTFEITPKPITITPTSGQTKVYGTADPTLTFANSPALVGTDAFTGALARAAGSNVGTYLIGLGSLSAGPNYTLSLAATPVTFEITPNPITITPTSGQTKVYGTADPTLSFANSPALIGTDAFTGALAR